MHLCALTIICPKERHILKIKQTNKILWNQKQDQVDKYKMRTSKSVLLLRFQITIKILKKLNLFDETASPIR
jgi:hypothetical protein